MAWKHNTFTIVRGEDAKLVVLPMDSDGEPVILELMALHGTLIIEFRTKKSDGTLLIKSNETSDVVVRDWGPPTCITVQLTRDETALLPLGTNHFDLVCTVGSAFKNFYPHLQSITVIDPIYTE